jgi:PhnB protein
MSTKPVKPIPEGYHTFTPYLCFDDAAAAIEFYKKALGATELFRMADPSGRIAHAEIKIGDSPIMLSDQNPEHEAFSPTKFGGSPAKFVLYVEDVDARIGRAVAAGAKLVRPIENHFYGDRSGTIKDPFGYTWYVSTHIEDVSPDEVARRAEAAMAARKKS